MCESTLLDNGIKFRTFLGQTQKKKEEMLLRI